MTSKLRAILLAGLLAGLVSPALAQDESLAPDGDEENANWFQDDNTACTASLQCDTVACDASINELPASPDDVVVATITNNNTIFFDFPTPTANPSTVLNDQAFEVVVSRCTGSCVEDAGGTNPNYDLVRFCNGVNKGDIVTGQAVSSLDQLLTHTWTHTTDGDCDAAGANVQIGIQNHQAGGGGNRRHVCVEAFEWEVTHAVAGGEEMMVIGAASP